MKRDMTKTMRILTLLLLTMAGTGQAWAGAESNPRVKFIYASAHGTAFASEANGNGVVTITITPDGDWRCIDGDVTAKVTANTNMAQAPRRTQAEVQIGDAIDVTCTATNVFTLTLPDNANLNATVTISFSEKLDNVFTVSLDNWTYGEAPKTPHVENNQSGNEPTYTYSNAENGDYSSTVPSIAGTHWVKASIAASTDYKAGESAAASFEITQKPLTDEEVAVSISKENDTYAVSVKDGEKTLVLGTDYTLSAGQTSSSNYIITVTGTGNYTGTVTAAWIANASETDVAENVTIIDDTHAVVSSIEVGAETTTVTISGTVNDGTNDVPVTSIADGTFTSENTANVQSIDLSATQIDLDMDRTADNSPVKDVPENTLIYLPAGSTMTGDNVIVKETNSDNFTCENFVMTDNKSYSVPHAFTAVKAILNRVFTAKQTCTVCLPFSVPPAEIPGRIYRFTSVANNQVTMTEDADGLDANVPYIFVPDGTNNISTTGSIAVEIAGNNTSANDFTFKSIYEDHTFTAKEIAKGIYGFAGAKAVGTTPGRFAKAATGAYIKGMRAYLEYTGSAIDPGLEGPDVSSPRYNDLDSPLPDSMNVILVDADGTTTNIGKMELMEDGETPRYNLSGQRVGKSHKGIVIENSKKMVIK